MAGEVGGFIHRVKNAVTTVLGCRKPLFSTGCALSLLHLFRNWASKCSLHLVGFHFSHSRSVFSLDKQNLLVKNPDF